MRQFSAVWVITALMSICVVAAGAQDPCQPLAISSSNTRIGATVFLARALRSGSGPPQLDRNRQAAPA
jgi:hypothetical protein